MCKPILCEQSDHDLQCMTELCHAKSLFRGVSIARRRGKSLISSMSIFGQGFGFYTCPCRLFSVYCTYETLFTRFGSPNTRGLNRSIFPLIMCTHVDERFVCIQPSRIRTGASTDSFTLEGFAYFRHQHEEGQLLYGGCHYVLATSGHVESLSFCETPNAHCVMQVEPIIHHTPPPP